MRRWWNGKRVLCSWERNVGKGWYGGLIKDFCGLKIMWMVRDVVLWLFVDGVR